MAFDTTDPRVQRLLKEREMVKEAETRREQQLLAKKLKIAEAMGLSEEEKSAYIKQELPDLKTQIDRSTISSEPGIQPESISETKGIGPLASGEKYASLLDSIKGQEIEAPALGQKEEIVAPEPTPQPLLKQVQKPELIQKKDPVTSLLEQLGGERQVAKAEREAAMQRADIGELASLVGRSLTQIGAAYQGAKTGTDMSNVAQQTLINWDKRRDQIMDEYKQTIGELDKQQTSLEREKERADNLAERAADRASREAYQDKSLALQAKNAELADRRLSQQWEMAMLRNELDMAKLMSKNDAKGIQALTKKYTGQLKDVDAEMDKLRAIQAMDVAGKKKPQEVAAALAELYGREIAEEPGTFYGTNVKSKKQIAEIVKGKLDTLQVQKDRLNNLIANGVKYEAVQEAPAAGEQEPAAAAPAPTPAAKPLTMQQVEAVAKRDGVSVEQARAALAKRGHTILE